MRTCIKCKAKKEESAFKTVTLKYTKKNGDVSIYNYLDPRCIPCVKEYNKKYSKKKKRESDKLIAY